MKTKQDIIDIMAENSDVSKKVITEVVQQFVTELRNQVVSGESVRILELGTFSHVVRDTHMGKNPATGEPIVVPKRLVPKFKFNMNIAKTMNP